MNDLFLQVQLETKSINQSKNILQTPTKHENSPNPHSNDIWYFNQIIHFGSHLPNEEAFIPKNIRKNFKNQYPQPNLCLPYTNVIFLTLQSSCNKLTNSQNNLILALIVHDL